MIFLSTEKLGGIKVNGNYMDMPDKPWDTVNELFPSCGVGNIYRYNTNDAVDIADTPSENAKKINWHKFKNDNDKLLYVCDRVVINNLAKDDIIGLLNKTCIIDGKQYRLKILEESTLLDLMSGEILGTPECYVQFDSSITKRLMDNPHNKFWNYVGAGTYVTNIDKGIIGNGYYSPSYVNEFEFSSSRFGVRPVLEEVSDKALIDGVSGRIGEFKDPFVYEYKVKSDIDNDTINVVEKINNVIINTYKTDGSELSPTRNIDLADRWSDLGQGVHKIEIIATNSNNIVTNNVATFSTSPAIFLDKDGLNYYTQQFWNSKIKPMIEEFSKKAGGLVLDSSNKHSSSIGVVENSNYVDNGKRISINGGTEYIHGAVWHTSDIRLGKHALTLRASTQVLTSTGEQFVVIVSRVSEGSATEISRKVFNSSQYVADLNNYKVLNMTFEYSGTKNAGDYIKIEVVSGKNTSSYKCAIDYVLISPLLPSSFA